MDEEAQQSLDRAAGTIVQRIEALLDEGTMAAIQKAKLYRNVDVYATLESYATILTALCRCKEAFGSRK